MANYYEIKIRGHLNPGWTEWFEGFNVVHLENEVTLLYGWLPDQAALYGLLKCIRDLNLTLLSVSNEFPASNGKDTKIIDDLFV